MALKKGIFHGQTDISLYDTSSKVVQENDTNKKTIFSTNYHLTTIPRNDE